MKGLSIVTPTQDHLQSAFRVFEASIADAFEQEGLGHLKDDIRKEIEFKQMLLSRAVENPESGYLFLIAVLNGEVVGTVSFGPCGDDVKRCTNNQLADVGELGSLYVLPAYQGRGVGTALIQAMMNHLEKLGVEFFSLDCGLKRAQKIWVHKFGEPYVIAQDYWGQDAHHMVWLCRVSDFVRRS